MSDSIRVLICVLTTHERNGWVCPALCEWLTDLPISGYNNVEYAVTYAKNFVPAASARNFLGRKVKESDPKPDWVLMMDNDMPPPKNLFDCVINAPKDAMVVVPQMQMWDEGKPSVTLCWGMDESIAPKQGNDQRYTIEPDKWYELTKCGTGIIFIRPEVFERLSMPYFWYPLNADQGIEGTEDVTFTQKVVGLRCAKCGVLKKDHITNGHEFDNAGMKIYGYSGCIAGHYHNVNLAVVAHYLYGEKPLTPQSKGDTSSMKSSHSPECPSGECVAAASPAC